MWGQKASSLVVQSSEVMPIGSISLGFSKSFLKGMAGGLFARLHIAS